MTITRQDRIYGGIADLHMVVVKAERARKTRVNHLSKRLREWAQHAIQRSQMFPVRTYVARKKLIAKVYLGNDAAHRKHVDPKLPWKTCPIMLIIHPCELMYREQRRTKGDLRRPVRANADSARVCR